MSKNIILITDTLFISSKHEMLIKRAGFDIHRIENPNLSERELCEVIKGKVGYILGGVEQVTKNVIDSADKLKAISFTGAGYKEFIPAYKEAKKKGILISAAPGGNADAVAEYCISLMLMMSRDIINLGRTSGTSFKTTTSIKNKTVGIVGLGRIGLLVATYLKAVGVKDILYCSKHRKYGLESGFGLKFVSKDDLLRRSHIVSIHVSKDAGDKFISGNDLKLMQDGAILINTSFPEVVDLKVLYKLLKTRKISAAFDKPPIEDFSSIPPNVFFYSNSQTAYNTVEALETVSDMATLSIINLLTKSHDIFCVNK